MRLSLMGLMGAAVIAAPVIAAPAPGGPAPAEARAGLPPSNTPVAAQPTAAGPQHRPPSVQYYVDLNSASRKELMTLPGIGKAEADRIVANRPYLVKTDLVSKNVLTVGPFLSIKHLVVAMPKSVTQAKP